MISKENLVVFVDDERSVLTLLKGVFRNEPYGILTVTDTNEAFKIISKGNIKVVVSDQIMPEISGIKFLKKVKKMYPDIVRILLTADTDITAAKKAINVGEVYRFILKPWNSGELKASIRQAIQHFDLIVENRNLFELMKAKNLELKIINKKLKEACELQKEFTSTVSHELRTPLASIKAAIDIVISRTAGDLTKSQEEFLGKAKVNIDRLRRLINDVLDFSKLESGNMELEIKPDDINKIIQEVVEVHEPDANKNGLYLKGKFQHDISQFPFDSDRINQVLNNLINNAIKFTSKGGVTVSSEKYNEHQVRVCVQDTGKGIKKSDRTELFKKYHQLGNPESRQKGGTGLGLAICKQIIEQHGGEIWVESDIGKGSCFYFVLPTSTNGAGG